MKSLNVEILMGHDIGISKPFAELDSTKQTVS